ncbi:hypothetical protein B0O99DRAFT_310895 [Bisporella sp. PMI_857]|nr:hypothetical protein B0O99DRAFT_310895 [Bisporella sp. PMI_857]
MRSDFLLSLALAASFSTSAVAGPIDFIKRVANFEVADDSPTAVSRNLADALRKAAKAKSPQPNSAGQLASTAPPLLGLNATASVLAGTASSASSTACLTVTHTQVVVSTVTVDSCPTAQAQSSADGLVIGSPVVSTITTTLAGGQQVVTVTSIPEGQDSQEAKTEPPSPALSVFTSTIAAAGGEPSVVTVTSTLEGQESPEANTEPATHVLSTFISTITVAGGEQSVVTVTATEGQQAEHESVESKTITATLDAPQGGQTVVTVTTVLSGEHKATGTADGTLKLPARRRLL